MVGCNYIVAHNFQVAMEIVCAVTFRPKICAARNRSQKTLILLMSYRNDAKPHAAAQKLVASE
jgi:hypothetical protein